MTSRPVHLTSDVHLGAIHPERERAFHSWLEHTAEAASALVLNGDLFDFWFEYRRGVPGRYGRTLTLLRELVASGLPVTLMGGNHDWWGGAYLREEIGVEFLQDPVVREYAGLRTFLAHGDGLGRGDLSYRFLRLVLRGRATRWAFAQLGPALGDRIAAKVSVTDRRWGEPTGEDLSRARALRTWAIDQLAADPDLDLIVLGHTHVPTLVEVPPGRWYANAGDWVRHRSYLVLAGGLPPELREWNARAGPDPNGRRTETSTRPSPAG